MRIGIVGLPNSGKTTLFNILTGGHAPTTAYAGGAFQVNTAVVHVPDARVDALSHMYKPKKTTYAKVEYADIAGLSGGEGERGVSLSGELMNAIGVNDALLHVVRVFQDDNVPHPLGSLNPVRDIEVLDAELTLSDLSKIENRLSRLESNLKKGKALPTFEDDHKEFEILTRLKPHVEQGQPIRDFELTPDEEKRLRGFQFLTAKPVLIVLNLGDEGQAPAITCPHQKSAVTAVRGKLEMDIAQLDNEDDRAMFMAEYGLTTLSVEPIIRQSYDLLDRMAFFTVGEDEVRAWEVHRGATALEAAGAIHSDLARGFIRAEVVSYDDLMAAGSNAAAKAVGKVRLEGKEHLIQDGDIIVVRFNIWVAFLTTKLRKLKLGRVLNTAFVERVNLTLRQRVPAIIWRTWPTAQEQGELTPQSGVVCGSYHFIRVHETLRVEIVQPRERAALSLLDTHDGGKPSWDGGGVFETAVNLGLILPPGRISPHLVQREG